MRIFVPYDKSVYSLLPWFRGSSEWLIISYLTNGGHKLTQEGIVSVLFLIGTGASCESWDQ